MQANFSVHICPYAYTAMWSTWYYITAAYTVDTTALSKKWPGLIANLHFHIHNTWLCADFQNNVVYNFKTVLYTSMELGKLEAIGFAFGAWLGQ